MEPTQNDSFGSFSSGQGGYIGQPGAYSAEPVVLGNDGRKKSKKWVWIILIGLLVVAITIVAVTMLTMSNEKKQKKAATEKAFYEVANYVMGGEDGDDDSSDLATRYDELIDNGDLLYAIAIRQESFNIINDYFEELNNKKQLLITTAKGVIQEETLNDYVESLKVLENAINYYMTRENLVSAYETGRKTDAQKYIQQNIKCDGRKWELAVQCNNEMNYYEAFLRDYVNNNNQNDETYLLLQDGVLSGDSLLYLDLGVRGMQKNFLKELNNE